MVVESATLGEYLELSSPTCASEVLDALADVLSVPARAWHSRGGLLWRLEYQQVDLILDDSSDGPGTARLALADLTEPPTAHRLANRIYRHLQTTTPWEVVWTADTEANASDPAGAPTPAPTAAQADPHTVVKFPH